MARYSQVELYKKAQKLLGGKGVVKKVAPPSPRKTGFPTDTAMYAEILRKGIADWSDKQDKDAAKAARVADQGAARSMFEDYRKPQPEWNAEEYGTTPDDLRTATMPGALTGNVGATYDPNVKPFPGEDLYDGTDTAQGMAAALGAPNAALGSPLDPGRPYAAGGDEEGDDANWMNPAEHKAFYENEALNAQAGFDEENPTGMARVDQGDYGVAGKQSWLGQLMGNQPPAAVEGEITGAMRMALMGDTIAKREDKEAIARAIVTRDEERAYQSGLKDKVYGRQQKDARILAAAKVEKDRLDRIETGRKERAVVIEWDRQFSKTDKGKKEAAKIKAEHVKTNKQMEQSLELAKARTANQPLTLQQGKSGGFALRMEGATSSIAGILNGADGVKGTEDDYDPTGVLDQTSAKLPRMLSNFAMSEVGRAFRQAKENWVTANLRLESGAVISPAEMENEFLKYFPEANDTPKVLRQKTAARNAAYASMKVNAGRAFDLMREELGKLNTEPTVSNAARWDGWSIEKDK